MICHIFEPLYYARIAKSVAAIIKFGLIFKFYVFQTDWASIWPLFGHQRDRSFVAREFLFRLNLLHDFTWATRTPSFSLSFFCSRCCLRNCLYRYRSLILRLESCAGNTYIWLLFLVQNLMICFIQLATIFLLLYRWKWFKLFSSPLAPHGTPSLPCILIVWW